MQHIHLFEAGASARTLLLLHGTGGNERDLLALGRAVSPNASMLSPRGRVLEGDMPRWFRRLGLGVFDVEDLQRRASDLGDFLADSARQYRFDPARVAAVGYSNGANIAAGLLLARPELLAAAVLFRPMMPYEPDGLPRLEGKPVWIGAGRGDEYAPEESVLALEGMLKRAGAQVTIFWSEVGHAISNQDVNAAREWLRKQKF